MLSQWLWWNTIRTPWSLGRSFKVCSVAKDRVGCQSNGKLRIYPYLVKLQPGFLSLQWKTCLWAELRPWFLSLQWRNRPWAKYWMMMMISKVEHTQWFCYRPPLVITLNIATLLSLEQFFDITIAVFLHIHKQLQSVCLCVFSANLLHYYMLWVLHYAAIWYVWSIFNSCTCWADHITWGHAHLY